MIARARCVIRVFIASYSLNYCNVTSTEYPTWSERGLPASARDWSIRSEEVRSAGIPASPIRCSS